MLTHIDIKNFILVDKLSLDFSTGLHILTGETGAGKSIWVDAINLALGGRTDTSVIKQGQTRCDITLIFDVSKIPGVGIWLQQHQFESESSHHECLIRRVISTQGPSRSTINGIPCPMNLIRELGEMLLTIHGQNEQHELLKTDGQQQQLDRFGKTGQHIQDIQVIYHSWKMLEKQIDGLNVSLLNRQNELELLNFQNSEFEQLSLKAAEWEELSQLHRQLHHTAKWQDQLKQVLNIVSEQEKTAALNQVYQAITLLNAIKLDDAKLLNIKNLLNEASIHLQEAGFELNALSNDKTINPKKLVEIEQRLNKIYDLSRKHRVNPQDLFNVQQTLLKKITQLENADNELNQLKREQQEVILQFQKIAEQLTKKRENAAKKLNQHVTTWMQQLGMQGGSFQIILEKNKEPIHPLGNEKIRFLVSTNPGQTPQPLSKIASGGELSRLHLALQAITAEHNQTMTLIFDEVDVGIGGPTAVVVGRLLRQLGEKNQVLCITHLPQVAAFGHHHYQVSKLIEKKSSSSTIQQLNSSQRVQELARMLGGESFTSQSIAHAKAMLEQVV